MARQFKKRIRLFEERPSYGLGVRQFLRDPSFPPAWLDHVEDVISFDPARGLPLARTAVRLTRRIGSSCLRARAIAGYAAAQRALGRFVAAERVLQFAFTLASDCEDCLALLYRQLAYLRSAQQSYPEALHLADMGISAARNDPRALLCRGIISYYSGRSAVEDLHRVIEISSPGTRFYQSALHLLPAALGRDPERLGEAEELLPRVEEQLKGARDLPIPRVKLEWLKGSIYAAKANHLPDSASWWERRTLWRRSVRHLDIAFGRLLRMTRPLPLEIAACAADLAAAEARGDRYKVANVFTPAIPLWPEDLVKLRETVIHWATARVPGATAQMWAALKALRDATVERGCAPPLVPYLDPTAAL